MKKHVLLLAITLFIFSHTSTIGQNIAQYLPKETITVVAFNAETINKKVKMNNIWALPTFQMIDLQIKNILPGQYDLISAIYKNPKEVGIDLYPQSYMSAYQQDSAITFSWIFSLSDKNKFEKLAEEVFAVFSSTGKIEKASGYKYIFKDNIGMAWNGKIGGVFYIKGTSTHQATEGLNTEDENYYDKLAQAKQKIRLAEIEILKVSMANIMKMSVKKSLMTNANFQLFQKENFDIGTWVSPQNNDIDLLGLKNNPLLASLANPDQLKTQLQKYTEGNYVFSLSTFENGSINTTYKQFTSADAMKLFDGVYTQKVNTSFFDYIDNKYLLGFMSVAADWQKIYKAYTTMYEPVIKENKKYQQISDAFFNYTDSVFGTKDLSKIFGEDAHFAVIGVKQTQVTYTDYDYDEDYNPIEVQKVKNETLPLVVMAISAADEAKAKKMIEILQASKLLPNEGKDGIYRLNEMPYIKDAIVFTSGKKIYFTNAENINVTDVKANGIPAQQHIPVSLRNQIGQNNYFGLLDIHKGLLLLADNMPKNDQKNIELVKILSAELTTFEITGVEIDNKKNTYISQSLLKFTDKSQNSFYKIFEITDKLVGKLTK
jgi:hypothetical protein